MFSDMSATTGDLRLPPWDDGWILLLRTPQKGTPQRHATHGRIRRRNWRGGRTNSQWFLGGPMLVGGFFPSEKYASIGIILPNRWDKMFQTTNQTMYLRRNSMTVEASDLFLAEYQTQRIHHGTPSGRQINVYVMLSCTPLVAGSLILEVLKVHKFDINVYKFTIISSTTRVRVTTE